MDWVEIIWSMFAATCLTLAIVQGLSGGGTGKCARRIRDGTKSSCTVAATLTSMADLESSR
jgi:hypothetical protein